MVYIVTYQQKTFQLQILCLKFVKFYICHENQVKIPTKIFLFLHKQNSFPRISLIFFI